ncbi:hypothetical protein EB796_020951 [Bugula neritina]|uniref:Polycystin domain-containing protein n=1 Tax=Bugula neritina TaxID=10212 RepID=A0A7J7J3Q8_BUGNE|nr:hypothetical protein EB796_020951 [Bugula neritina]
MSAYNADRGEYGLKWTKVKDGEEAEDGFKYQNATALEGLPTRGLAGYYEGGGYAYTLGRSQASAFKSISHLKENDWIDEHTRAIFVEFTIFNNQLNLFTSSFIIFEMMPTGALYPKFKVLPFRLERYRGNNALMTLLSELGMIAYTIYFFVKEIKLMKKQRRSILRISGTWWSS